MIEYVNGTSSNALSFQIWDIDGFSAGSEKYSWRVFTDSGELPALGGDTPEFITASAGASLDALPYMVEIDAGTELITRVEIDFTGTKTTSIGLAFDNFNPTGVIPEPTSLALLLGCALLFIGRRRR